jgi:hypothetical protein
MDMRRSCKTLVTNSVDIALLSLCWAAIWQMLIVEIFVVAKKYQRVLLTTYDRESMPEK